MPVLLDYDGEDLVINSDPFQRHGMGSSMSNYQQQIRDIIFEAVERNIPIYEAAYVIEQIIRKQIDGEACG